MQRRALALVSLLLAGAAACDRERSETSSQSPEAGALSCDDLGRAHAAALAEAKKCTPSSGTCDVLVEDRLGCACTTYVSPGNQRMIEALERIKRRWTTQLCAHSVGCVPTPCPDLGGAHCEASGRCVDLQR